MTDIPENKEFKMNSLAWRKIFRPQVIIYALLPAISGSFFVWFKTGYYPLEVLLVLISGILISAVNVFTFSEMFAIKAELSAEEQKADEEANHKKETTVSNEDKSSLLFVRKKITHVIFVIFPLVIGYGMFLFKFSRTPVMLGILIGMYILASGVIVYLFADTRKLLDVFTLLYFSGSGIYAVVYMGALGILYPEVFSLTLPLLVSVLIYIIMRYFILSNNVYIPEESVQEEQEGDKRDEEEISEESPWLKLDIISIYLIVIMLLIILYYLIIKNMFLQPYISGISVLSIIWGGNLLKQILLKDFSDPVHLSYMYKETKIIYLWLNVAIALGFGIQVAIMFL